MFEYSVTVSGLRVGVGKGERVTFGGFADALTVGVIKASSVFTGGSSVICGIGKLSLFFQFQAQSLKVYCSLIV